VTTDTVVAIALGTDVLAFTATEIAAARTRAIALGLASPNGSDRKVEPLVDSQRMAEILGVPHGWVEEAARQGRIPSMVLGKYRRFTPSAVVAALAPTNT
jgi:excisionase family DNA binding protein